MKRYRLGVIGLGKIAVDRHLPVIAANPGFETVAVSSQRGIIIPGVARHYRSHETLLAESADLDAIAICTPPDVRHCVAIDALAAGKHILLEKPPTTTVGELADLESTAAAARLVVFATWHSQFNASVERARAALAGKTLASLSMVWSEDVNKYHLGQQWIWRPKGFGVFDAGINGLSILTRIVPRPLLVKTATLSVPDGAQTPIAAEVTFSSAGREAQDLRATFDWRATEDMRTIEIQTTDGMRIAMTNSGRKLEIDGRLVVDEPNDEYRKIYERFHDLLSSGQSEVDVEPLRLVADIVLAASWRRVPAHGGATSSGGAGAHA